MFPVMLISPDESWPQANGSDCLGSAEGPTGWVEVLKGGSILTDRNNPNDHQGVVELEDG